MKNRECCKCYNPCEKICVNYSTTDVAFERPNPCKPTPCKPTPIPCDPCHNTKDNLTGDIVIIGAGAAGSLLAHYLARFSNMKIILLEAGHSHFNDPVVTDPMGFFGKYNPPNENISMSQNPSYSWQGAQEPNTGAYGNRPIIAHGMGFGGSTMINRLNLVVGGRTVFDNDWPVGWKYDDVKNYFRRVLVDINPVRDNTKASITSVALDALRIIAEQQIASGEPVDFLLNKATGNVPNVEKTTPDAVPLNLNDYEGVNSVVAFSSFYMGVNQLSDGNYIRKYAGNTYLNRNYVDENGRGIGKFSGLRVVSDAVVDRIIFKGNRAVGVNYIDREGIMHYVKVNKEVVVTSGAFYTPTILQRSGIGDFTYLSSIGVKNLVYNNPLVGTGLKNHYSPVTITRVHGEPSEVSRFLSNMAANPTNMGFKGLAELGFHRLDPNKPANANTVTYRKYQLMMTAGVGIPAEQQYLSGLSPSSNNLFTLIADDIRFAPEGYIKIGTPNIPRDVPKIFFNTFVTYTPTSAPADQQWPIAQKTLAPLISALLGYDIIYQTLISMNQTARDSGFQVSLEMVYPLNDLIYKLHNGLATYGANWWHYFVPTLVGDDTPAGREFADTLSKLSYYPRVGAHLDSHQGCSCSIGRTVDSNLKVIGTQNVRVADLSAAAFPPGGNTWATASMIGARAVDLILGFPYLRDLPVNDVPILNVN
ncbi:putative GMC-type oxidoreductase [Mimivirus reunion]|uniref:GMC-type oxidoreductase n=1 Tax=Mimivirus sp. 'reunion' TaxID=2813486 RepID=A0ACD6BAG3_9VIRU|nr:putative GMC-type oxidoreductase [Mimivirus reunion]WMV61481.1 putative GMC-type oxidoreductase [Mimivirus sp.]7YX3_A Chain A, Putative GMC-type oxidoreductase [Acanthamoeba polyphaga mimivirus]7YX3_B Chain B, Putative GMC-type oxidoreductase [Acanthamoeba polyphaga mimivirus]